MHTIRPLLELVNEWGRVRQWRWWVEVKSGRESGEEELVKAALFCSQEKQVKIWWRKDSVWRILWQIKHTFVRRKKNDACFSSTDSILFIFLHVSSRGAAWLRSPWWRRPGWSRASSCCSPSSACSSSWWRWQCPPLSSACASAPTSAWRRSWPAWELTPVLMPPQPIRLEHPLQREPIREQMTCSERCHWKNTALC